MTRASRSEQNTVWKPTLLGNAWYASCPAVLQDALLQHGRLRKVSGGGGVFEHGATDQALYCVLSGQVQVYYPDASGAMPMLATLDPPHWFGEMSFIDGEPRSHEAVAEQQALLLCVARADLQSFLEQHAGCWRDIARLAVSKLRTAYQLIPLDAQLPARTRLIKRLWLQGRRAANPFAPVAGPAGIHVGHDPADGQQGLARAGAAGPGEAALW